MKRAYVEIDLNKVASNINDIMGLISPRTKFMAVVKADGYGHGAAEIANIAIANGAQYLGVAWVAEAAHLRSRGIVAPILILSEPTDDLSSDIVKLNLTQTVYSYQYAKLLNNAAKKLDKIAKVHVKIDTGMNRIGVSLNNSYELIDKISELENIQIEGVFTHFPSADLINDNFTLHQIEEFTNLVANLKKSSANIEMFHMANSKATRNYKGSHFDMVRIGHDMYTDALTFKSKVAYIHEVHPGDTVSYGREYKVQQKTHIATISAGYADGFPRLLSNTGKVLIGGVEYPVVGKVCMDMTMVDIGLNHQIKIGDSVILIGKDQGNEISIQSVALQAKTIDYEIMCGIGKRVPRIYI